MAPVVFVRITRTTTTTIYKTTTDILLSGTFAASYNIVEIINKKGKLPEFLFSAYETVETWSDTWGTTVTITTTTQLDVGNIQSFGTCYSLSLISSCLTGSLSRQSLLRSLSVSRHFWELYLTLMFVSIDDQNEHYHDHGDSLPVIPNYIFNA